jgi:hypothetical protein
VNKSFGWEYRLFSRVLLDELSRLASVRKDLDYGLVLGRGLRLSRLQEVSDWAQVKLRELASFGTTAERLVNTALPEAVGAPGEPGSVDAIVYVAKRLGQVYRLVLEWTGEFKHAQVEEDFVHLLEMISTASQNIITEIEEFSVDLHRGVEDAVRRYEETKQPQSFEITLTLTCPDIGLDSEIARLSALDGL